jgi:hypothetical protein
VSLELDEILDECRAGRLFRARLLVLDKAGAKQFQRMRQNPTRFTPKIFEGDWSDPSTTADASEIRLLAAVKCPDHTVRLVGRQGRELYALTIELP